MSPPVGTRLGAYEIVSPLGAGGMGEVYRAKDTKLGRDVALKILPASFTNDPERVARFRREAQVLASLNHPHIAQIHGLEEVNGTQFLVLELVDGESLDKRIARGPIPVDEALGIAKQIAEALEAAHEKGIIHRDLKPANIALTTDGNVKVLDFGLAKAVETTSGSVGAMNSPTITSPAMMTGVGVILGTAAYMSPEQAKGRSADKQSDIWAFGCVLFEMLTGRPPFDGDDVAETLAAVLRADPDSTLLPSSTPAAIGLVLDGCLKRDRKQRIADISTAAFLLRRSAEIAPRGGPTTRPAVTSRGWPRLVAIGGSVVAAVIAGWIATAFRPVTSPIVVRIPISLPSDQLQTSPNRRGIAVAPDGARIAYVANNRLYLRALSELEATPIAGTENSVGGIGFPVFSPDGQSIAFYASADSSLKRVAVGGGAPITICRVTSPPNALTWDGPSITFTESGRGIMRVAATGGSQEVLIPLAATDSFNGAQVLPDGEHVLYAIVSGQSLTFDRWTRGRLIVESLKTHERKVLLEGGMDPRYVPTGHILYTAGGVLFALRFDARRLTAIAPAVSMIEGVARGVNAVQISVSPRGTMAFIPGPATDVGESDLAMIDDRGVAQPFRLTTGAYETPRLSPDGKRVAFSTDDGRDAAVWIYELNGGRAARRLTVAGRNRLAIWSADGSRVAFQSDAGGSPGISWQRADGVGVAERLTSAATGETHVPETWLPHGDQFVYSAIKDGVHHLYSFSVSTKHAVQVGHIESTVPINAMFSPDGKWLVYTERRPSAEAAPPNPNATIYVQPFPPTGAVYQLTRGENAHFPVWSRDGKTLFYVPGPGRFASIDVATDPTFSFANPVPAPMVGFLEGGMTFVRSYDLMPDAKHVIGTVNSTFQRANPGRGPNIEVIVNWFEELNARVPAS
jgi:serine/threonine-protein kinase